MKICEGIANTMPLKHIDQRFGVQLATFAAVYEIRIC